MLVLVDHSAEAVASAYVQAGDLSGVGDGFGECAQRRGCLQGTVGAVLVVELLVLAQDMPQVVPVPDQGAVEELAAEAEQPSQTPGSLLTRPNRVTVQPPPTSSTIGRLIGEIRPLLAERGFAVLGRPGVRLCALEDVSAYAEAEDVTLRIDGMETQVRRPRAGRPGRSAFVSGKRKQNTVQTTTISDAQGRTLWWGAVRPSRMHDQTAMRTKAIAEQFRLYPTVKGRGRRRLPGPGERVPRSGIGPAEETEGPGR
uniref:DDE Tnp4 domain-containing protein n=1 Tax=Streptomyces sp. NBC_00003 TaxID=2903608 RepID=A0AAU2VFD8_9ACTN